MKMDMNKLTNRNTVIAMGRLFNAVPVAALFYEGEERLVEDNFVEYCLGHHFIVMNTSGQVIQRFGARALTTLSQMFGYRNKEYNQALHKSFQTVADMEPAEYYAQQIMHYFSTYGLESFGLKSAPYIPMEELNLPQDENDKGIRIVWALTPNECQQRVQDYFKTTQRPHNDHIQYLESLLFLAEDMEGKDIPSFELKCLWYKYFNRVPQNGQDFLRFLVYTYTGSPMLIKNKQTVYTIKYKSYAYNGKEKEAQHLFAKANLAELATIFLRFKPIFLAFKSYPGCAPYINKIRRLAKLYHKPLSNVNVRNISTLIKDGQLDKVAFLIKSVDLRTLIKLANYAALTQTEREFDCYTVRNGKVFLKKAAEPVHSDMAYLVATELLSRVKDKLKGQYFVLPDYLRYATPYSEKQMVDTIPWGTFIPLQMDKGYTLGIHWVNTVYPDGNEGRIDLDLHLADTAGHHIGWNGNYQANGSTIVYSGDMTNAPIAKGGATETMYIKFGDKEQEDLTMSMNRYSGNKTPFTFFVAPHKMKVNYVVDMNKVLFAPINLVINEQAMNLGLINKDGFYFFSGSTATHKRVPNIGLVNTQFIKATLNRFSNMLSFAELLQATGATIIWENVGHRYYFGGDIFSHSSLDMLLKDQHIDAEVISLLPNDLTSTSFFDILNQLEEVE